jgi:hypothetical protein
MDKLGSIDFCQPTFFEKIGVFLQTNLMVQFCHNLTVLYVSQNAIFVEYFF